VLKSFTDKISHFCENIVETVMVNDSTNIKNNSKTTISHIKFYECKNIRPQWNTGL